MARCVLGPDERKVLRSAVLECLDYKALRPALADVIDAASPALAQRLRTERTYELTLRALDCGVYYDRNAATSCRGLVMRYERVFRSDRRILRCHPLLDTDDRGVWGAVPMERCGLDRCHCDRQRSTHYGSVWCWCVMRDHCLALTWRGLNGDPVPPDVAAGLAQLRESIRQAVALTVE